MVTSYRNMVGRQSRQRRPSRSRWTKAFLDERRKMKLATNPGFTLANFQTDVVPGGKGRQQIHCDPIFLPMARALCRLAIAKLYYRGSCFLTAITEFDARKISWL